MKHAWQDGSDDVRSECERDARESEESSVIDVQCFWCMVEFRTGADNPERFCSGLCDDNWCRWSDQTTPTGE